MKSENLKIQKSDNCIGCGICPILFSGSCTLSIGNDGFYKVAFKTPIDNDLFTKVCPVANNSYISNQIWGDIRYAYIGYSTNEIVRYRGSSGGVTSALAIYLLREHKVDAVIQIRADESEPLKTKGCISRSAEDVVSCCGSRYSSVSLFSEIYNQLRKDETYCLIGKPCDIRAFKNYIAVSPNKLLTIKYFLSFFCAGAPSQTATDEILSKMNFKKEKVVKFDYRGNGWPGFTKAVCADGSSAQMRYSESWGRILGRHIHPGCKFCVDGVGISADISCGDAWFCDEKGYPLFEEKDGQNIILVRSAIGEAIFSDAIQKGYIDGEVVASPEKLLKRIQPYQYKRKALMYTKVHMLKLFGKYTPKFNKQLKKWDKQVPFKDKFDYAKGTVERIVKKRIK